MRITAALISLALMTGPAAAQSGEWQYDATMFLWLPTTKVGVDTPRGTVSGELSVSDALDALDFAFMGTFEARRDKLSFITDLVYTDLTADQNTPFGGLFTQAAVANHLTFLTALGAYRVHEDSKFAVDVGGGLRAYWTDVTVTLTGGLLPTERHSTSDSWVDPIVAVRARARLSDKWFTTLYLDGGGFGVGSEQTYQAAALLGYEASERWSLVGGWRYLDFKRKNNGRTLDFQQSGIVMGATYHF